MYTENMYGAIFATIVEQKPVVSRFLTIKNSEIAAIIKSGLLLFDRYAKRLGCPKKIADPDKAPLERIEMINSTTAFFSQKECAYFFMYCPNM